uniref:Organic solute transporter subunit alpha n=2 Tax=Latimeria chalumnae TaxID=7897 RepID=H3A8B4_LATCH
LDITGIILFAVLTIMTAVALLVYVEEVVYIYKKIPTSKRSIVMWVNATAPAIASTSCIGMWIPRATVFTDYTTAIFFSIVVHKFLVMMIKECGGQKAFLKRFQNERFKLYTGPFCCCCLCLPSASMTRRTLFILKLGTFQFTFLRPILIFILIVLWSDQGFQGAGPEGSAALLINILVGISTITALYPVSIMFTQVRLILASQGIVPKFVLYQFIVILSQLQTFIISTVASNGHIVCAPPLSGKARASYMSQQLLIMEMFIITILSRFYYRRRYEDVDAVEAQAKESADNKENTQIGLNILAIEDGTQSV